MDSLTPRHSSADTFLRTLADALAPVDAWAPRWDRDAAFALEGLEALRACGALGAPLPADLGGLGLGTTQAGAVGIVRALRLIGRHSLSLARVYEGHVNALRLILIYGTRTQAWQAATDARAGHLFAIWAAEHRATRVQLLDGVLQGRKAFASAARHATRALLTVEVPGEGECLAVASLDAGHGRDGARFDLHGVRSAGTAPVDFSDFAVPSDAWVGQPGDYMREPEISLGAWRPLAVQSGGLDALVALVGGDLNARARAGDAHQLARFGRILVAQGTARLWVERAAAIAERDGADLAAATEIKLARIAVEAACVEVIALAQRTAGLAAFVRPHPIERVARDLSTYLRQPALDLVLDEAAAERLAALAA